MTILTDHLEMPASMGAALRRQRQSAGLTTAEVADAAGVSPRLLFLMENAQPLSGVGAEEVRAGLERICGVLEMDPEPLLLSSRQMLSTTAPGAGATSTSTPQPRRADPVTAISWSLAPLGVGTDRPTSMFFRPEPTKIGQADEPTLHTLVPLVADSDLIPTGHRGRRLASGRRSRRRRPAGSSRALRLATAGTALAVVACAVALAMTGGGATLGIHPSTAAAASTRTVTHKAPVGGSVVPGLNPTSPASATLTVGAAHYTLTVTTAAPCWVEILSSGGSVLWAGTLSAGQRETYTADQPTEVQLGAGSGRLAVSWGSHRYTLTPPVAPYTYSLSS
ncbi:MAG: helix-turn-helix domain-containing protein [Acidimicrobiales bacterium]